MYHSSVLPGVKKSIKFEKLLTSSGIPSFDNLMDMKSDLVCNVSETEVVQDLYCSGGYRLNATHYVDVVDCVQHLVFDPLEDLIWSLHRSGLITGYYGPSMEKYVSILPPISPKSGTPYELKQLLPSPTPNCHMLYGLSSECLLAYTKSGLYSTIVEDPLFFQLECFCAGSPNGSSLYEGNMGSDFSHLYVGGIQEHLLQVDAGQRWGEITRTMELPEGGCVVLKAFSKGLCGVNMHNQVLIFDPRRKNALVRQICAHTAQLSDFTISFDGNNIATCGLSSYGDGEIRVDRLIKIFDIRSGVLNLPMNVSVDPSFVRFHNNCSDTFLTVSTTGKFQAVRLGNHTVSPDDLGSLMMSYDQVRCMDISKTNNYAVFGMESGQIQLYSREDDSSSFNNTTIETVFGSSVAESLQPCIQGSLAQEKLNEIAQSALNSISLVCAGDSLYKVKHGLNKHSSTSETKYIIDKVEKLKNEYVQDVVNTSFRAVEVDEENFSLVSIPFCINPPHLYDSNNMPKYAENEKKFQSISDWPHDLCGRYDKSHLKIEADVLSKCCDVKITTRAMQKDTGCWFPYSSSPQIPNSSKGVTISSNAK